jgi:hypothetical protein
MRKRTCCLVPAALVLLGTVAGCVDDSELAEATYVAEFEDVSAKLVVPVNEARSIGTYRLEVVRPGGDKVTTRGDRDGMVSDLWLADLGGDGVLEAVVAISSVGSGSYGTVDVYRERERTFEEVALAPLDEEQAQGYMGHDLYSVEGGDLRRSFPRYLEGDTNAEPTGGTVSLVYSFTDGAWVKDESAESEPE